MSLGLKLWLRKRNQDRFVRQHARADTRRDMRQNWLDYSRRGRGNKAWKRVQAFNHSPGTLLWPDYAIA